MASTDTPAWDPASWLKQWSAAMQLAPNSLVQPILPGWTLNVNSFNSSAPQTEADVPLPEVVLQPPGAHSQSVSPTDRSRAFSIGVTGTAK